MQQREGGKSTYGFAMVVARCGSKLQHGKKNMCGVGLPVACGESRQAHASSTHVTTGSPALGCNVEPSFPSTLFAKQSHPSFH